jgi:hypothetical protein
MIRLLQKKSIGVSISDFSIEVVELVHEGKFRISSRCKKDLEQGVIVRGRIKDPAKLKVAFIELFKNAQPSPITPEEIILGLPEDQSYTYVFRPSEILPDTISRELAKSIPLEVAETASNYVVERNNGEGKRVLLVAASKVVLTEWNDFFALMNISIPFFDLRLLALLRNIFSKNPNEPICVLESKRHATSISIVDMYGLAYTHSIHLEIKELSPDTKAHDVLVKEIKGALDYYQRNWGRSVTAIAMIGELGRTKRFIESLEADISLPLKRDFSETVGIEAMGHAMRVFEEGDPVLTIGSHAAAMSQKTRKNLTLAAIATGVAILIIVALIIWLVLK